MKKTFIYVIVIICFTLSKLEAQHYSSYVTMSSTGTDILITKLASVRELINCDLVIDGRLTSIYGISTAGTRIVLPTSFRTCELRFSMATIGVDGTPSAFRGIGIAVIDDIDIKYFDNEHTLSVLFRELCEDNQIQFFIINNILISKECFCKYYTDYSSHEIYHYYLDGYLGILFKSICEKVYPTSKMANQSINISEVLSKIDNNEITNVTIYNTNGELINISSTFKIAEISAGIYIIKYIEYGHTITNKLLVY